MKSSAVYFTAPRKIEIREVDITPADGEVIFRSLLMGISAGTEKLFYLGTFPEGLDGDLTIESLQSGMSYPIKYGYLNIAESEDGKRSFHFFPHQLSWAAPPDAGIPIPADISVDDGIFLAQMETSLGIIHDLRPAAGETVLVMGGGIIGLLAASILKLSHWGAVMIADRDPDRKRWADLMGIPFIDVSEEGWTVRFRERYGEIDCGINASSSDRGLQDLIDLAAMEGTIIEASWYGNRRAVLELGRAFHRKRLRLVSSQVSSINAALTARWDRDRRYAAVFDLIRELSPSKLISHRFPFSRTAEAFELIAGQEKGILQAVLEPEE